MAEPETYLSDFVAAARTPWPDNRTLNIVCHGHSVPAGYFATPIVDTFGAYPHLLHKAVKQRYPHAVINGIVTAIGGENAERGADRFATDVLTHQPDVVTIDYSLNDRGMGLGRAEAAWRKMIEAALTEAIPMLLLTPTADSGAEWYNPDDALNQHAAQVRRLAAEYGVGLVDSLAAFDRYIKAGGKLGDLLSQPNHPNRKGHALVAAELANWFPK